MRNIETVRANFSGSAAKPGAVNQTTSGAAAMPRAAAIASATKSSVETASSRARVSSAS